jgi:hypothetical protein
MPDAIVIRPGMSTCPDCKGRGKIAAFIDTADGGWFDDSLTCSRCKGLGAVSPEQETWTHIGGTHRTWRVAQFESYAECAKRLGVSPAELSNMEHGRADPTILIDDTPEVLRDA